MATIPCPHCQRVIPLVLVKDGVCPNCLADIRGASFSPPPIPPQPPPPMFEAELATPLPTINAYEAPRSRGRRPRTPHRSLPTVSQPWIASAVIAMLIVGSASALFGAIAGQYFPLYGGFLVDIAEPWSIIRNRSMISHVFSFGITAVVLTGCGAVMVKYLKN